MMDLAMGVRGPIVGPVAEAAKTIPQLPVRKGGIFHHPPNWTEEEDEVIAAGLRANLPLSVIGIKVNCERHALARHIDSDPGLRQLKIDCRESRIDQAEFQADRLVQAGNPSMIMFTLERLGRDRGWGQQETKQNTEEESRIVFGEIPEEDVKKADAVLAKIAERTNAGKVFESDPAKAEREAQEIDDGARQFEGTKLDADGRPAVEGETPAREAEVVRASVGPAPYADEPGGGYGDGYGDGFEGGFGDDPGSPFAGGEDSPFGY